MKGFSNMRNMRKCGFSALAALILTALAYAQAPPVSFEFTNEPGIGEANILFGHPQQGPATTITGTTVHGIFSAPVNFTSTRTITAKGGQSNIDPCTNGVLADCPNGLMTSLKVTVPGPRGVGTGFFTGLILDPQKTAGDHDLFALVATNMGPVTSPAFGDHLNGNNFLTIEPTSPGVEITSVTLTSTGGFLDLKQPRVLGVNGAPPIPEPSSILLMASGMLGLSRVLLRKLL
jgi:hypothetical protein